MDKPNLFACSVKKSFFASVMIKDWRIFSFLTVWSYYAAF